MFCFGFYFDRLVPTFWQKKKKPNAVRTNSTHALALFIESLDIDDVIVPCWLQKALQSRRNFWNPDWRTILNRRLQWRNCRRIENRAEKLINCKIEQQNTPIRIGLADDLVSFEGLTIDQIIKLGENNIKTLDDLADLIGDELVEILGENENDRISRKRLDYKAREHWFADEAKAESDS